MIIRCLQSVQKDFVSVINFEKKKHGLKDYDPVICVIS